MIRALRDVPIRRKLMSIIMLSSSVSVLLACSAFVAYDFLEFNRVYENDAASVADLIADNSASALAFNDPDSAAQTLQSLIARQNVNAAAIYDMDGRVFATYSNSTLAKHAPPSVRAPGSIYVGNTLQQFTHVKLSGDIIGDVYLETDLSGLRKRMRLFEFAMATALLGAMALAFLTSAKLQTVISVPLMRLADMAKRVAGEKNYTLRAVKAGDDEIGKLIDSFNEMLNEIQQRDLSLQQAQHELENRIQARTQELARSLSLLNTTLEASGDGILAYGLGGKGLYYNKRYQQMWSMPDALLQPDAHPLERVDWIAEQTKHPEQLKRSARTQFEKQLGETNKVYETKDGRTIEVHVKPQRSADDIIGVVVSFRDITERRRAEQELETINRQLLETSRQAGMAEVASGVLHNVGNVLNSVNVSASLVAEYIKSSRVAGLTKVAALLREHQHDIGDFIVNDVRGKHLPAYLLRLADYLPKEQQIVVSELEALRSSIEHIKQIVAMQQTYSKVSGVKELVNVIDLVEDSLRMNKSALTRHGISVQREFEDVPLTNIEKHKVLQILVNLIRNAKYACSESSKTVKQIRLRVSSDDSHIRIEVIDNGIGISPENLTRIFSHGFTTRKDGHGFGLHTGAIAAHELGGSLRAYSSGPDQGATFTLELPIVKETVST